MNVDQETVIIGGHGRVALKTSEQLVANGWDNIVCTVRNLSHVSPVEAAGARPKIFDVRKQDVDSFMNLISGAGTVVWCAGAGGRSQPEETIATDRDGALKLLAALRKLKAEHGTCPRLILVSFAGATTVDFPEGSSMHVYAEAKRTVDNDILDTKDLTALILAPTHLTMKPSTGIEVCGDHVAVEDAPHTSRALVARLIAHFVMAQDWKDTPRLITFHDGDGLIKNL